MHEPLPYASVPQEQTKPSTVGFMLGILGLGLVFLGGCFMIGIMLMQFADESSGIGNSAAKANWSLGRVIFVVLLYACALGCFGGAVVLLKRGAVKLLLA